MRAAAIAASQPACPAPTTTTSNCSLNCMDVRAKVGPGKLGTSLATSELSFVLPSSAAFYKEGPMRRLTAVGLLVLSAVAGFGIAQSAGGRGPSTPEERSRF